MLCIFAFTLVSSDSYKALLAYSVKLFKQYRKEFWYQTLHACIAFCIKSSAALCVIVINPLETWNPRNLRNHITYDFKNEETLPMNTTAQLKGRVRTLRWTVSKLKPASPLQFSAEVIITTYEGVSRVELYELTQVSGVWEKDVW